MSERLRTIRILTRWSLAIILTPTLLVMGILFVRELGSDPNPALTALLGSIAAPTGTALVFVVRAVVSNPSDIQTPNDD